MSKVLKVLMIAGAVLAAIIMFLMTHGCATTAKVVPIVKACEPTTSQESAILGALSNPAQAAAMVEMDALDFGLCVLQKGVDEIIEAVTPKSGTTAQALTAAAYSPVLDNARAWRAAHP
jgi:hypothetical protein